MVVQLASVGGYDALRDFVLQEKWKTVVRPGALPDFNGTQQRARDLLQLTDVVRAVTTIFLCIGVLLLLTVLWETAHNAVRAHRKDIDVLQSAGADMTTIALPFVVELSVLLMMGLFAATVLCAGVLQGIAWVLPGWNEQDVLQGFVTTFLGTVHAQVPLILLLEVVCVPLLAMAALAGVLRRTVR